MYIVIFPAEQELLDSGVAIPSTVANQASWLPLILDIILSHSHKTIANQVVVAEGSMTKGQDSTVLTSVASEVRPPELQSWVFYILSE